MSAPSVLVIQNDPDGGPRRLADWLAADGVAIDVARPYDGEALPARLEHDGFVMLGGGYMPDADDRASWLAGARSLATQALEAETPMFGICLGGQLLAHVAGGRVKADVGAPEYGSVPIRLRPEAETDPLLHGLPATVPAIEHHVDAITELPESAVWLAETDRCPYQAFRVGAAAWGVQFHPEAAGERIATWTAEDVARRGFDKDELLREAEAAEPKAVSAWREVARRFAALVHEN